MFTSDNGYYQGEHRQRQGKINGHEPSLRVPFLVTGPGMRSGTDRYAPITTIDVTASILDLAGAQPPVPADGTSRAGLFTGGDAGWTVPVLHEVGSARRGGNGAFAGPHRVIGVRTARYSLMRYEGGDDELYDLVRDPAQNRNVWGSARYRDVRDDLVEVWSELRDCAGAACRSALPASLAADRGRTRELGRGYWKAIQRRYGASG
jgi:arylsulfatase A-like enzyme